jgi:integrase
VGGHAPLDSCYKQAEHERLIELREDVDLAEGRRVPTVMEFAGAMIHANGRVTMSWPEGQRALKETGRRASTLRRMRDGLKPLVRDFGDRPLDSFSRHEVLSWALPRGPHVQQSARQFFNHALDHDLIPRNVFTRLGVRKRTRRVDRPGFEVISDEQYQRLCRCARTSRTDGYGLILEGVILAIGEAAMRPGEIFALHHNDIDYTAGLIHLRRQLDLASGITGWPKDDEPRVIAMTPRLHRHLKSMPRLSPQILFPTPRGHYMRRSTWSAHWHSVRAAAQMPGLEFYELRHRAIQWMIDPPHNDGLGLDIQTAAYIAGHQDGGYLVCAAPTQSSPSTAPSPAHNAPSTPTNNANKTAPPTAKTGDPGAAALQKNCASTAIELQYAATTQRPLTAPSSPQKSATCGLFSPCPAN